MRSHALRPAPAALLLASGLLSGCVTAFVPEHQEAPPTPAVIVVEITGSPGVTFEGSIGTPPSAKPIDGPVPARYTVETAVAAVISVTKKQEDGELTVRLLRRGQETARRTTSAPYGTLLLVAPALR